MHPCVQTPAEWPEQSAVTRKCVVTFSPSFADWTGWWLTHIKQLKLNKHPQGGKIDWNAIINLWKLSGCDRLLMMDGMTVLGLSWAFMHEMQGPNPCLWHRYPCLLPASNDSTYIVCQLKVFLACQLVVHSFNQLQDLQQKAQITKIKVKLLHLRYWYSNSTENTVANFCFPSPLFKMTFIHFFFLVNHQDRSEYILQKISSNPIKTDHIHI